MMRRLKNGLFILLGWAVVGIALTLCPSVVALVYYLDHLRFGCH